MLCCAHKVIIPLPAHIIIVLDNPPSPNMKTHHTVDERISQIDLLREFIENILGLRKADLNFKDVDQKDVEKNVSQTLLSLIRLDAQR